MSQYAIVETGSKQYRVEPNNVIEVEKLEIPVSQKEVSLEKILLVRDGDRIEASRNQCRV